MFLAVNHAIGTLKCHNLTYFMRWLRAHQFLQWVSVYSLQPRYRLKTWSNSTMGADRLNSLALAYVHDITPEQLQILQKCMGRQWSEENCFSFLQIKRGYTSALVHLN